MIVLETQRLLLRQLETSDLAAMHRILSDPITMTFWPAPLSLEAAQTWIERQRQSYRNHGFGRYALISKDDHSLIGDCGIIPSIVNGQTENDLGYVIFHTFWQRGYATEAAEACKHDGLERLGLARICANMPADHLASRRVAEKIGMSFEREFYNTRNRNILTCLYAFEQRL